MGKLKLLYDVFKTMKEKDFFRGSLKVEGTRDDAKVFEMNNIFEKNTADRNINVKVSLETECDGKKLKHESTTRFDSCGKIKRTALHHMHARHLHGSCGNGKLCAMNSVSGKLACFFGLLNGLKIEEQADKNILTLNFSDLPEDLKTLIHEKIKRHHTCCEHSRQKVFKEFSGMEVANALLSVQVNKKNEVEKVTIEVVGRTGTKPAEACPLSLCAELTLAW